jgi:hypothetical protein
MQARALTLASKAIDMVFILQSPVFPAPGDAPAYSACFYDFDRVPFYFGLICSSIQPYTAAGGASL